MSKQDELIKDLIKQVKISLQKEEEMLWAIPPSPNEFQGLNQLFEQSTNQ